MPHPAPHDPAPTLTFVLWGPTGEATTALLGRLQAAGEQAGAAAASAEAPPGRLGFAALAISLATGAPVEVRVFAAGDAPGLEEARARLLAVADGALFTAPLEAAARSRARGCWRELLQVTEAEEAGPPLPVAVFLPASVAGGTGSPGGLPAWLAEQGTPRGLLGRFDAGAAAEGLAVLLRAALTRALPDAREDSRAAAASALAVRLKGDSGVFVLPPIPPRPDALPSARSAEHWMRVRDSDLRDLERERGLRHLLADVGAVCAAAIDVPGLARAVLLRLVTSLEARAGWLGLPRRDGRRWVHDAEGVVADATPLLSVAHGLEERAPTLRPISVDAVDTVGLPGDLAGGSGLFLAFPVSGPERGWMLLLGGATRGLPDDARGVLAPLASFLGMAVARLEAMADLTAVNRRLEETVAARTAALRHEKRSLERRVRERTQELEIAKAAALDSERRLLDRERREGVHRLAAGIAHELNNPLGALRASLEFVRDTLAPGPPPAHELDEVREAVKDALQDASRMAGLVESLFGEAVGSRLAAVRTDVGEAVAEAVRHWKVTVPDAPTPAVEAQGPVACGVALGELVRWLFRALASLGEGGAAPVTVVVAREDGRPRVDLATSGHALAASAPRLEELRSEVEASGAQLTVSVQGDAARVRFLLPRGVGDREMRRVVGARP